MGFDVRIDDVRAMENAVGSRSDAALLGIQGAQVACENVIGVPGFSGRAASSAKRYLGDVHRALLAGFQVAVKEYVHQLMMYRDDLQNFDNDVHAAFHETYMSSMEAEYRQDAKQFDEQDAQLTEIIASIDDLLTQRFAFRGETITSALTDTAEETRLARETIGTLERKHANDLEKVTSMLSHLTSLMGQIPAGGGPVTEWRGGPRFTSSAAYLGLMEVGKELDTAQDRRTERIGAILVRNEERNKQLLAEEREQTGWGQVIGGVLTVIGSAVVIVGTGGAAIPIVIGVAGIAFAASDIGEGADNIHLGQTGDLQTQATNPMAKRFFNNDMEAYHNVEGLVYAAQFAMPYAAAARFTASGGQLGVGAYLGLAKGPARLAFASATIDPAIVGDVKRVSQRNIDFSVNNNDPVEFKRQLAEQEAGMNQLTVKEFLDNRDRYRKSGRGDAKQYVTRFRTKAKFERMQELMDADPNLDPGQARQKAEQWARTRVPLHVPDMVAGGSPDRILRMGDAKVNSAIGGGWPSRARALEEQIREETKNMTDAERATTYLNVKLQTDGGGGSAGTMEGW